MDATTVDDRLLDLAAQNVACARTALARGQRATACESARCAIDLLYFFNQRLPALHPSEPNTAATAAGMASGNSSITTTTTPTPRKEEAKATPPRDGATAGALTGEFHP